MYSSIYFLLSSLNKNNLILPCLELKFLAFAMLKPNSALVVTLGKKT